VLDLTNRPSDPLGLMRLAVWLAGRLWHPGRRMANTVGTKNAAGTKSAGGRAA
jgi:hypothetical protein